MSLSFSNLKTTPSCRVERQIWKSATRTRTWGLIRSTARERLGRRVRVGDTKGGPLYTFLRTLHEYLYGKRGWRFKRTSIPSFYLYPPKFVVEPWGREWLRFEEVIFSTNQYTYILTKGGGCRSLTDDGLVFFTDFTLEKQQQQFRFCGSIPWERVFQNVFTSQKLLMTIQTCTLLSNCRYIRSLSTTFGHVVSEHTAVVVRAVVISSCRVIISLVEDRKKTNFSRWVKGVVVWPTKFVINLK